MGRWRGVIRVWVPLAFVVVGMAITIRLASG
jgi:hypothetical protein